MYIDNRFTISRYAYKTQACYQCTSIEGNDKKCENMDDDYSWDELDTLVRIVCTFTQSMCSTVYAIDSMLYIFFFRFRYVCPVESECIVTIGRVWPIVEEVPPKISNETEKEEAEKLMGKKYEGKNFIKRSCVSKAKLNDQSCKSFPSESNFG